MPEPGPQEMGLAARQLQAASQELYWSNRNSHQTSSLKDRSKKQASQYRVPYSTHPKHQNSASCPELQVSVLDPAFSVPTDREAFFPPSAVVIEAPL
jgi:hypothetical protein